MKGISLLTGTLIALGLGVSPAAFANDDLDEVTVEFVFDDLDEVGAVPLSLEDEEVARDERGERESDGEDGAGTNAVFNDDDRVAELADSVAVTEHDEQSEGELEDNDVGRDEFDPEHDGELGGEDGLAGEDVAAGSDLMEEMSAEEPGEEEVAEESEGESMDDAIGDDLPEEEGDLA